ncbi:cysteine hydrolase family protein [Ochrobactrum quorumnocens]|uniref:cysteine hydrolase family protein n=2 Tax=Ochrobactrum quorumnocens TaxID=271865 RepID=UPI000BA89A73|nr:cysteine hydrolase [[Ochrobactrum] quorumnocens]
MPVDGLIHGPLGNSCLHLCVDMQRLFAPGGPWAIPWTQKVLPNIEKLSAKKPERTIFTRFIPARRIGEGRGMWKNYYRRWRNVTLENLDPDLIELMPNLSVFSPPAKVLDKHVYSPWSEGKLDEMLGGSGIDSLVITGGETDVCVLGTIVGAVDRGFRVVIVTDAICSSVDQTHDALMTVFHDRYSEQIETATMLETLEHWQ